MYILSKISLMMMVDSMEPTPCFGLANKYSSNNNDYASTMPLITLSFSAFLRYADSGCASSYPHGCVKSWTICIGHAQGIIVHVSHQVTRCWQTLKRQVPNLVMNPRTNRRKRPILIDANEAHGLPLYRRTSLAIARVGAERSALPNK